MFGHLGQKFGDVEISMLTSTQSLTQTKHTQLL